MIDSFAIPVERHEAGYRPTHSYRVEDCYIWRTNRASYGYESANQWRLRVNKGFTNHPTLKAARIEASRIMGVIE